MKGTVENVMHTWQRLLHNRFHIKSKKINKVLCGNFSMRTKKYHHRDIQQNEIPCHREFNDVDLNSEKANEENKSHRTMSPKRMHRT